MRCPCSLRCLPGDEKSMQTLRSTPREAGVLSRAAALNFRVEYRKQQALQVVTPRVAVVLVEMPVDYVIKYGFNLFYPQ